jgi:hypothetical protein
MAGNDFKKVNRGERLDIPAPAWNALMGLCHPQGRPRGGTTVKNLYARNPLAASLVKVRNDHTVLTAFSILGITDTVLIDPATSADTLLHFKQQPTVAGDEPAIASHRGRFVVLIEDIAGSEYGMAVISGVTPVKIDVRDADHRYAEVKDADTTQLQSGPIGTARILWKESGTGTKWAIVNLGVLPPCLFPVKVFQTGGSSGNKTTQADWTYTVKDIHGFELGTVMTPLKVRPEFGSIAAPPDDTYGTGFFDADGVFQLWDANETLNVLGCS